MMKLPSELCWRASVGGRLVCVANRTKNAVRVMCSRLVRTCIAGNRCFPIAIALGRNLEVWAWRAGCGFGSVSPRILVLGAMAPPQLTPTHSCQSTAALPLSRIPRKNWASSAKQSGLFSSNHSVSMIECLVFLNLTRANDNLANIAFLS